MRFEVVGVEPAASRDELRIGVGGELTGVGRARDFGSVPAFVRGQSRRSTPLEHQGIGYSEKCGADKKKQRDPGGPGRSAQGKNRYYSENRKDDGGQKNQE